MMSRVAKWRVVFTRPRSEPLAAASLRRLHMEVFSPMARTEKTRNQLGATKPLFPQYLFARVDLTTELSDVRHARGVVRVLGSDSESSAVSQQFIDSLRNRLNSEGWIILKQRPIRQGDQVVVSEGPFSGLLGRVECERNGGKRVMLLLDAIQQAQIIVEKDSLKLAAGS